MLIKCHACEKVKRHWSRGLCRPCYSKSRYHKNHCSYELTQEQTRESKKKSDQWQKEEFLNASKCLECNEGLVHGRGLCKKCYNKALKNGELNDEYLNYFKTPEETELWLVLERMEKRMSWEMPKLATEDQ